MQDVIDSVGFDRAKDLLVYYFKTNKSGHPLSFFFYNFDKIDYLKSEREKDEKHRRLLLQATKELVEGESE
jgi:D-alanyl-lipoteichoic acid acyltransferase DltB (MBOAT superfamily)